MRLLLLLALPVPALAGGFGALSVPCATYGQAWDPELGACVDLGATSPALLDADPNALGAWLTDAIALPVDGPYDGVATSADLADYATQIASWLCDDLGSCDDAAWLADEAALRLGAGEVTDATALAKGALLGAEGLISPDLADHLRDLLAAPDADAAQQSIEALATKAWAGADADAVTLLLASSRAAWAGGAAYAKGPSHAAASITAAVSALQPSPWVGPDLLAAVMGGVVARVAAQGPAVPPSTAYTQVAPTALHELLWTADGLWSADGVIGPDGLDLSLTDAWGVEVGHVTLDAAGAVLAGDLSPDDDSTTYANRPIVLTRPHGRPRIDEAGYADHPIAVTRPHGVLRLTDDGAATAPGDAGDDLGGDDAGGAEHPISVTRPHGVRRLDGGVAYASRPIVVTRPHGRPRLEQTVTGDPLSDGPRFTLVIVTGYADRPIVVTRPHGRP